MTIPVTKNCKVDYEYFNEMTEKILENVHHQSLESSECIAQPERHPGESKSPPFRRECGLQSIAPLDEYLVISGKSI